MRARDYSSERWSDLRAFEQRISRRATHVTHPINCEFWLGFTRAQARSLKRAPRDTPRVLQSKFMAAYLAKENKKNERAKSRWRKGIFTTSSYVFWQMRMFRRLIFSVVLMLFDLHTFTSLYSWERFYHIEKNENTWLHKYLILTAFVYIWKYSAIIIAHKFRLVRY